MTNDANKPAAEGSSTPLWLGALVFVVLIATGIYGRSTLPGVEPAKAVSAPAGNAASSTATPASAPKPDIAIAELMAPTALPDMVLGDAKAPVTVIEYASFTCPHCAEFHKSTFGAFKTKYIDTGKVRFIFRPFTRNDLDVAVSMLASCGGPVRYFAFAGAMFDRQQDWAFGDGNALPKLQAMAKQAGFTDESFAACLKDKKQEEGVTEIHNRATTKFGVTGTPTFFVNGLRLKEEHDLKKDGIDLTDLDAVLKEFGLS